MTTKRTPKTKTTPSRPSPNTFIGFVNISLNDSTKEDILNEFEQEGALEKHLDSLLAGGFKVSFSYDDNEGCYQATATGGEHSGSSKGYATSARSEDIVRSLLALSAKVFVIADADLSAYHTTGKRLADI